MASYRRRAMELAAEIQALAPVDEAAQMLAAIAENGRLSGEATWRREPVGFATGSYSDA
jgi:hypothetical protein